MWQKMLQIGTGGGSRTEVCTILNYVGLGYYHNVTTDNPIPTSVLNDKVYVYVKNPTTNVDGIVIHSIASVRSGNEVITSINSNTGCTFSYIDDNTIYISAYNGNVCEIYYFLSA